MGPCCKYCYTQYINKDNTIDEAFVLKEFGSEARGEIVDKYVVEEVKKPFLFFFKKMIREERYLSTSRYVRIVGKPLIELCSCDCHEKGSSTFH